jgi:hypothetical protein
MVNGDRYVYRMNEGDTYDGKPIRAYWQTQKTDMGAKFKDKKIQEIYIRGEGDVMNFNVFSGNSQNTYPCTVSDYEVIGLYPDIDSARTFYFRIENEAGSRFTLEGGMEVNIAIDDRSRFR